jgi:hypothetical protein
LLRQGKYPQRNSQSPDPCMKGMLSVILLPGSE